MSIIEYTVEEGGKWYLWPLMANAYILTNKHLNAIRETHFRRPGLCGRIVIIHNVELHAFKTNVGRIWDALNGWRDHDNAE